MSWWPYAIVLMVGVTKFSGPTINGVVILAYLNSLINPCLYMIINRDVRFELKKIFRCVDPRLVAQSSLDESSSHNQHLSIRRIKKMFTIEENPTESVQDVSSHLIA